MLGRFVTFCSLIFDRPRCAMCHQYSQPGKVFCTDVCKLKLDALHLPTADVGWNFLEAPLLSQTLRCRNADAPES